MRGVIEIYDSSSKTGVIVSLQGQKYAFSHDCLTARSRTPRPEAKVVFRQKHGSVLKATVISHKRQWDWLASVGEALLYLPFALVA